MLSREKRVQRTTAIKILWAKEEFLISLAKLRMDDISFLMDGWMDRCMDGWMMSLLSTSRIFLFFFIFFPRYVKLKSFLSQEEF
jgi:hypothetical protein